MALARPVPATTFTLVYGSTTKFAVNNKSNYSFNCHRSCANVKLWGIFLGICDADFTAGSKVAKTSSCALHRPFLAAPKMAMSRYLTAQKISLLVLVRLYCESVLPSSATIPVLSFILSHAVPPSPSHARSRRPQEQHNASFPIYAFEEALQAHASSMPGRTLLDIFLKRLWEVNSFDALHHLLDSLGEILVKDRDPEEVQEEDVAERPGDRILLSKTSPLGAFVRRARLEFTRLQFDDAMKLWAAFITYRAPTAQWTRWIAGLAESGADSNISKMGLQPGDDLFEIAYGHLPDEEECGQSISMDDLEHLLEFQLDRLQRMCIRRLELLFILTAHRARMPRAR